MKRQNRRGCRAQTPLGPVACHRIADPLARGVPDTRCCRCAIAGLRRRLQDQPRPHRSRTLGRDTQKIGSRLEPDEAGGHIERLRQRAAIGAEPRAQPTGLGRQALAALRAARGQHPTPASGRHSRTEAMPTLADQSAGLVSALHGTDSDGKGLVSAEGAVYGSGSAKSTMGLGAGSLRVGECAD